jgi:gliding motility-associated lipoprotein GldH
MRSMFLIFLAGIFFTACDDDRVYENNVAFNDRLWMQNDTTALEFDIQDPNVPYNLYLNLRNSVDYPYSRIFVNYKLQDSTGRLVDKEMVNTLLFDPKTGEPHGTSGLGDIYDHQIPLRKNFKFNNAGKYKMFFEQVMRKDTLEGILAVGVRVERVDQKQ